METRVAPSERLRRELDDKLSLPGVISRKKRVAPKLMAAEAR
jgi:inorganic pyrophosphatase/exopolyphosphatase